MGIWKVKVMRKAAKNEMPREREMVFSNPLKTRKSKGGEKNFWIVPGKIRINEKTAYKLSNFTNNTELIRACKFLNKIKRNWENHKKILAHMAEKDDKGLLK